jgi:Predicted membrane protein
MMMSGLFQLNLSELFIPSVPLPETFVRGTCTYLALFLMLRFFRRQTGSVGPADLLVLIIVADAAQNAMAADYTSITDGLLLVATIIFWECAIDYLAYHVKWFGRWIEQPPLPLVQDGTVCEENLRRELMTKDDLLSQVRQRGLCSLEQVRESYIEGNGRISVIPKQECAAVLPTSDTPTDSGG